MYIGDIDTSKAIFTVNSSNVGEFSRTWGHILDEHYDKFFKYPTVMYITNLCWGIPTFGVAFISDFENDAYFVSEGYRRLVTDCIRVQEWNR